MEVISGAASVIGIVSLAIQLTDSVAKLSDFLASIQEAPDSIKVILRDLDLLSTILSDIQLHENKYAPNASVKNVLASLELKVATFMALIKRYEPDLKSSSRRIRKWTSVKAAFKDKKFKGFQESLNETKITLILA